MREYVAQACTTGADFLGESCRWDETRQELMWVDQLAGPGHLYRARADGARVDVQRRYDLPGSISAFAPLRGHRDRWIVAMDMALWTMDIEGALEPLVALERPAGDPVHLNDGAADPWGRFWVGSMANDAAAGRASLYRYDPRRGATTVMDGLTISNGLGWSPSLDTMYFVDSGPGTIFAFDVDDEGEISKQRVFAQFDVPVEGTPDGLCVDVEGALWVAVWGGYEVRRYSPEGDVIARVRVDTAQPSSCALGGANGTTLYITTARDELSEEQLAREELAGRLFCAEVGVQGLSMCHFDESAQGSRELP